MAAQPLCYHQYSPGAFARHRRRVGTTRRRIRHAASIDRSHRRATPPPTTRRPGHEGSVITQAVARHCLRVRHRSISAGGAIPITSPRSWRRWNGNSSGRCLPIPSRHQGVFLDEHGDNLSLSSRPPRASDSRHHRGLRCTRSRPERHLHPGVESHPAAMQSAQAVRLDNTTPRSLHTRGHPEHSAVSRAVRVA